MTESEKAKKETSPPTLYGCPVIISDEVPPGWMKVIDSEGNIRWYPI